MKATLSMDESTPPWYVITKTPKNPLVGHKIIEISSRTPEWALGVVRQLTKDEPLDKKWESRKVNNRATHFTIMNIKCYISGVSLCPSLDAFR